jgi:HK97 family phage prohead protease
MTTELERRTLVEPVEFRKADDGKIRAAGYAYVFGKRSQNLGGFVEEVAPGAGKKSIQEQDIRALFNHDPNKLLGRMGAGTLRMGEDDTGGHYEVDLPDTTDGRNVAALLERQDLVGSSFGFRLIEDEWGETDEAFPLRTLKQISIRDVGPVTFPAYTDTTSSLRSLAEARSLDLHDLVQAAQEGRLHDLIATGDTVTGRDADEGRVQHTFVRERITHLTC